MPNAKKVVAGKYFSGRLTKDGYLLCVNKPFVFNGEKPTDEVSVVIFSAEEIGGVVKVADLGFERGAEKLWDEFESGRLKLSTLLEKKYQLP